jgi:hypothetical protein
MARLRPGEKKNDFCFFFFPVVVYVIEGAETVGIIHHGPGRKLVHKTEVGGRSMFNRAGKFKLFIFYFPWNIIAKISNRIAFLNVVIHVRYRAPTDPVCVCVVDILCKQHRPSSLLYLIHYSRACFNLF